MHNLLTKHGKVFVAGVPGVGKSDFVLKYLSEYGHLYTNVIYWDYSGDLIKDMPNSRKFVMSFGILPYTRQIMRSCVILRNERSAKKKSTVVNNNRAPLASERCVATDEICVKGVRGCFPDKRFIGSCFGRGL